MFRSLQLLGNGKGALGQRQRFAIASQSCQRLGDVVNTGGGFRRYTAAALLALRQHLLIQRQRFAVFALAVERVCVIVLRVGEVFACGNGWWRLFAV